MDLDRCLDHDRRKHCALATKALQALALLLGAPQLHRLAPLFILDQAGVLPDLFRILRIILNVLLRVPEPLVDLLLLHSKAFGQLCHLFFIRLLAVEALEDGP